MVKPQGIYTSLVTPFDRNAKVDERQLRRLIEEMIHSGIAGIYILGDNSESHYLSTKEKLLIASVAANVIGSRIHLIAESRASNINELVEQNQTLVEIGVNCISISMETTESLNATKIIKRCQAVADKSPIPIMLKTERHRHSENDRLIAVQELCKHTNISSLVDNSSDLKGFIRFNKFRSDNFSIFTSNDSLVYWALLAGGSGAVSTVANALPKLVTEIYSRLNLGDCELALIAQRKILKVAQAVSFLDKTTTLKEVTTLLNMPVGSPRNNGDAKATPASKEAFDLASLYLKDYD